MSTVVYIHKNIFMMTVKNKLFMKNTMTFFIADSYYKTMNILQCNDWKKKDCNPLILLKESMLT